MEKINKLLLKPTSLISDTADSIKNGFKNVFNNSYNQIMCWAHMKRKVEHRLCQSNNGWYQGLQLYAPSTNNALEATNKTFKADGISRERHVLSRFLTISSSIMNNWSIERDPPLADARIFATEPTISLELWTSSYQWTKSTKDIICIPNDSSKKYYISARDLK
ncbi:unnamed protein product [Rotaria sp. Silwood2]|nr:unnamed protein product [Rotaria sp. Silwood2]CAF2823575.1 unnamed protein product [Rotaria sp. Silwood2]CAF3257560.1 unnamed protein product [Rotaria sp. Silwood2]CAF3309975.1 unnamed protein product [Rotaria sp. Silwood2]CAF4127741.1 unnamed protein product [Rotaria sp. Silwood2]